MVSTRSRPSSTPFSSRTSSSAQERTPKRLRRVDSSDEGEELEEHKVKYPPPPVAAAADTSQRDESDDDEDELGSVSPSESASKQARETQVVVIPATSQKIKSTATEAKQHGQTTKSAPVSVVTASSAGVSTVAVVVAAVLKGNRARVVQHDSCETVGVRLPSGRKVSVGETLLAPVLLQKDERFVQEQAKSAQLLKFRIKEADPSWFKGEDHKDEYVSFLAMVTGEKQKKVNGKKGTTPIREIDVNVRASDDAVYACQVSAWGKQSEMDVVVGEVVVVLNAKMAKFYEKGNISQFYVGEGQAILKHFVGDKAEYATKQWEEFKATVPVTKDGHPFISVAGLSEVVVNPDMDL